MFKVGQMVVVSQASYHYFPHNTTGKIIHVNSESCSVKAIGSTSRTLLQTVKNHDLSPEGEEINNRNLSSLLDEDY